MKRLTEDAPTATPTPGILLTIVLYGDGSFSSFRGRVGSVPPLSEDERTTQHEVADKRPPGTRW